MSDDYSLPCPAGHPHPSPAGHPHPSLQTTIHGAASRAHALRPEGAVESHRVLDDLGRASERAGLVALASRIGEVRGWLAEDLRAMERTLGDLVAESSRSPDLARRTAAHLLESPGKRIRPLCVFLGARVAGLCESEDVRSLALACELVHAATLLHDDVIDEGKERRGKPTARVVYGNSASILAGDCLLVEALQRVSRTALGSGQRAARVTESLLDTIAQMVAAEALQLEQRGRFTPDTGVYMRVIDGKTASLFRWALSSAPLLSGAALLDPLSRIGTALGMAFQLVDDVLDLEGDAQVVGKDMFADLEQGKLTHPLIMAAKRDELLGAEVTAIARDAARGDADPERCTRVVARIRKSGAIDATRALASSMQRDALTAISELPDSRARHALSVVVESAVERRL